MVAAQYKIPLPVSPPPSPPSCSGETALGKTTSQPAASSSRAASALKAAMRQPAPMPTPDTSRDEVDDVKSNSQAGMPELNDFELIRVLGKGCAGRVLLVKHTETTRVHAMKAISKRAVLANDELDHTISEQEILRHFSTTRRRNAFISRLYYSFSDKENFYLVMEFYPGGDLATQMEVHGILGPLRTRFYTCDIVAGLEALHREGILVRDLKPENILLNWHGHAVLADFGLSKNFGVRGDPVPVKLPPDYIEGKGTPPVYAGKGFGSYRNGELTWDRAYSFVGTQEYLAPEVIKRNHYTYAIDWWALGCIVCECLTGRVPFRGSADESNAELYERVINAEWDAMYRGDHPISYLKERYRIDSMTYDFIDGLLQKEPMFRLTEPSVKQHPYFTNVDWDTVDKGDYQDPHQLRIDPVAEYNTKFFPKLCLEETPTVDMSGHDYGKEIDGEQNALNNDEIYAKAQIQFAKELESFEWSYNAGVESEPEPETTLSSPVAETEPEQQVSGPDTIDELAGIAEIPSSEASAGVEPNATATATLDEASTKEVASPIPSPELPAAPTPIISAPTIPAGTEDTLEPPAPSPALPAPPAPPTPPAPSPAPRPVVKTTAPPSTITPSAPSSIPTSNSSTTPSITLPSITPSPKSSMSTVPVLPAVEIESMDDILFLPPEGERIASGPPSSGLSVSDIIAIPSSGPPLIIRRHRALPSIDSYRHARLSVDLNGTFGGLGDEEWEQLDALDAQQIPEAPNGRPGGLLARSLGALGKRPSRVLGRRTPLRKISDSEDNSKQDKDKDKTKHTKRTFKIKAFPPSKESLSLHSPPGSLLSPSPSPSASAVSSIRAKDPASASASASKRNSLVSALSSKRSARNGELQGLFVRPKARRARAELEKERERLASPNFSEGEVPKLELVPTPPIIWEGLVRADNCVN